MSTEEQKPDWDKISALFDKIDEAIDEGVMKNNMNFLEIDIAILLVNEKLTQEKHQTLNSILAESVTTNEKPAKDIYR